MPICLRLLTHVAARAFSHAWAKTGKRIAARMAMIAITTSSSIRVNPCRRCMGPFSFPQSVGSRSPSQGCHDLACGGDGLIDLLGGVRRRQIPESAADQPDAPLLHPEHE